MVDYFHFAVVARCLRSNQSGLVSLITFFLVYVAKLAIFCFALPSIEYSVPNARADRLFAIGVGCPPAAEVF
jgi:hypothetical protein